MADFDELNSIATLLSKTNDECVLATLVNARGSSYRPVGARMLIAQDNTAGSVSAGCLEHDIRECCFKWTERGTVLKTFSMGSNSDTLFGYGSGCSGELDILFERVTSQESLLNQLVDRLNKRQTCLLATVVAATGTDEAKVGARLLITPTQCVGDIEGILRREVEHDGRRKLTDGQTCCFKYNTEMGDTDVLMEVITPPISLTIFGGGDDVIPLIAFASQLGWYVTVCDKRSEWFNRERFAGAHRILESFANDLHSDLHNDTRAAAVVMTHNFEDDMLTVEALLRTKMPYVGLLGGRSRSGRIFSQLPTDIISSALEKVFTPAGLDLGAANPREIALSIVAEILSSLNKRTVANLKSNEVSIHLPVVLEQRYLGTPTHALEMQLEALV